MRDINKLHKQIAGAFAQYTFMQGDDFKWSALENTITHPHITSIQHIWSLLHELGHAELKHTDYKLDVALVALERDAWHHAATSLAPHFDIPIDNNYVQDHLDTYRHWLHQRSTCPQCGQNGLQANTKTYSCINCRFLWRTNEARLCSVRRVRLQAQSQTL